MKDTTFDVWTVITPINLNIKHTTKISFGSSHHKHCFDIVNFSKFPFLNFQNFKYNLVFNFLRWPVNPIPGGL